jgi:hypothetical protein
MIRIVSIIIWATFYLITSAQAQTSYYSREQKFSYKNGDFSIVGRSSDWLYTYRASSEGFFLDGFDDSMRLKATIALDFFPKKIYDTKFIVYPDQIIVLYQAIERNHVIQYAAILDSKARLLQKPRVLDSAKVGWMSSRRQYFSSAVSEDKNKIAVIGIGGKNNTASFKTILIDRDLNIINRRASSARAENDLSLGQILLDNDGVLYMSAYNQSGSRDYINQATILMLPLDRNEFQHVSLPLQGNYLAGVHLKLDNQHKLCYIGGFYSSKKSGNIEGVAYGSFSQSSGEAGIFKLIPADESLRNYTGEKNAKKSLNEFEAKNIIVKNDGGFILIAEKHFITTRNSYYGNGYGYYSSYYGAFASPTIREYNYGDIMALSYSPTGDLEWKNFIRKDQYSQEDGGMFSSYGMLNSGASLVFIYNDFSSRSSTLQLAALDIDGNLQMSKMNDDGMRADWIPRAGKQTDSREIVIPLLRSNNISFVKVNF